MSPLTFSVPLSLRPFSPSLPLLSPATRLFFLKLKRREKEKRRKKKNHEGKRREKQKRRKKEKEEAEIPQLTPRPLWHASFVCLVVSSTSSLDVCRWPETREAGEVEGERGREGGREGEREGGKELLFFFSPEEFKVNNNKGYSAQDEERRVLLIEGLREGESQVGREGGRKEGREGWREGGREGGREVSRAIILREQGVHTITR